MQTALARCVAGVVTHPRRTGALRAQGHGQHLRLLVEAPLERRASRRAVAGRRAGRPGDEVARRDGLVRALATLPRRQRAVIVLRYFEDLTEAQTAQALGVSLGTVKSQTAKALARLRVSPALSRLELIEEPS